MPQAMPVGAKLYSFKVEGEKANKKCKGIKKNIVKKDISFEDYVQCLFSDEKQMRSMKIIRSENHDIYSKEVKKLLWEMKMIRGFWQRTK